MRPSESMSCDVPLRAGRPEIAGCVLRIRLRGELDLASTGDLDRAIATALASYPAARSLELELSELAFCDVSGLNALVRQRARLRNAGRELRLVHPSRQLERLFAAAGLQV